MRRFVSMLLALTVALSLSVTVFADSDVTVTVDMNTTYQTIDGFGASYTWYSDRLYTNVNAEEGYDWIFNEAEFNILRFRDLYNVGDTTAEDGEYKTALNGYPAYKRMYDEAIERGIDPIVLVTSWGQYDRNLDWVAFNELSEKGYSYYTLAKDENGEYMYDALAQHCVEAVQLFFDAGLPVHYFSISNETELQERHIDEQGKARDEAGFFFGPDETDDYCAYWKAHIAVYEAFQEAFGEWAPEILGAECMAGYEDLIHSYIDPIVENCPESLSIIGHHLYGTDRSEANFAKVGNLSEDYTLWQTEWYYNDYFDHAKVMIDEFVNENISAYLYWNGVWIADTGNCLIEIGGSNEDAYIQRIGNHYIMTHFSKYIKQGYQRVDLQYEGNVKLVGFKSPDSSKLVIVALNEMESEEGVDLTIDLGGKLILDSQVIQSFEAESRFRHEYLVDMGAYDDGFFLPEGSLTTFVIDLEADPNYVAPVVNEEVNPFIKQPSATDGLPAWVAIAVGIAIGVIVAAVIAIVAVSSLKKKRSTASAE